MDLLDLSETFVVLSPSKKATTEPNTSDLYDRLGKEYGDFKNHELIAIHEFTSSWPSWEAHPKGDEVVILLEGEIIFFLDTDGNQKQIRLSKQGETVIVPKGVWHTAHVEKSARVLFITPGEGTENKYF